MGRVRPGPRSLSRLGRRVVLSLPRLARGASSVGLGLPIVTPMRAGPLLADDPVRRLALRQADQARDDFAQILDELDIVKRQLARLPTRNEICFMALRLTLGALAGVAAIALLMGR